MVATDSSIALSFSAPHTAHTQLGSNLSALRARLDQLAADLRPLLQSWSGDAQAAHLVQKRRWERATDDLARMLTAIVTGLANTSADYTDAQRRIVAAFS